MLKATWPEVVDALICTLMILICVVGGGYIVFELGAYILLWLFGLI